MKVWGIILLMVIAAMLGFSAFYTQQLYRGADNETVNQSDVIYPQYETAHTWDVVIGIFALLAAVFAGLYFLISSVI